MVYIVLNISKSYPTHYVLNPLLFACSVVSFLFFLLSPDFPLKIIVFKKGI